MHNPLVGVVATMYPRKHWRGLSYTWMDTMAATAYPWSTMDTLYSIARKFDGELNLVVWWLGLRNHQIITRLMTYCMQ